MKTKELAFSTEHRARLAPILQQLDDAGQSTFLDLCELVLMLSERTDGMLKFDHERVKVHIKLKRLSGSQRIAAAREKANPPPKKRAR